MPRPQTMSRPPSIRPSALRRRLLFLLGGCLLGILAASIAQWMTAAQPGEGTSLPQAPASAPATVATVEQATRPTKLTSEVSAPEVAEPEPAPGKVIFRFVSPVPTYVGGHLDLWDGEAPREPEAQWTEATKARCIDCTWTEGLSHAEQRDLSDGLRVVGEIEIDAPEQECGWSFEPIEGDSAFVIPRKTGIVPSAAECRERGRVIVISVSLPPTQRFLGRLVDSYGEPVIGASLKCVETEFEKRSARENNREGEFDLAHVPAGPWTLMATVEGLRARIPMDGAGGGWRQDVRLPNPPVSFSCQVLNPSGEPVFAIVSLTIPDGHSLIDQDTDEKGIAEFRGDLSGAVGIRIYPKRSDLYESAVEELGHDRAHRRIVLKQFPERRVAVEIVGLLPNHEPVNGRYTVRLELNGRVETHEETRLFSGCVGQPAFLSNVAPGLTSCHVVIAREDGVLFQGKGALDVRPASEGKGAQKFAIDVIPASGALRLDIRLAAGIGSDRRRVICLISAPSEGRSIFSSFGWKVLKGPAIGPLEFRGLPTGTPLELMIRCNEGILSSQQIVLPDSEILDLGAIRVP